MADATASTPRDATEAWTLGRVARWATEDFRRRGIDSARLDAELLLAHVLGIDRVRVLLDAERVLTEPELGAYRRLIQRRRQREPVAYLLGRREFHGHPFVVDARVLVPRPDTEALVEVALERTRTRHLDGDALDLCTGSGCVALAFALGRPTWRVTGVDVSGDAVAVARDNALRLGAARTARFLAGDLDAPLPVGATFDVITANPPYIPTAEIATLSADIREHEPHLALDGGPDGLSITRRVVAVARARLAPEGVLAVEVGDGQAEAVAALFVSAGLSAVDRRRDYGGIERVVSAVLGSTPG